MLDVATRAELELMAKRAYPERGAMLGESADGMVLTVSVRGVRGAVIRVEHDAGKVAGAMWAALSALQPDREGDDDA